MQKNYPSYCNHNCHGFVSIFGFEIFKSVAQKPIGDFRNSFNNLGISFWLFSEPNAPIKHKDIEYDEVAMGPIKAIPNGWISWDQIDVKGPKTIQEIIDEFKEKLGVSLDFISIQKVRIHGATKVDGLKMTPEEAYKANSESILNLVTNDKL